MSSCLPLEFGVLSFPSFVGKELRTLCEQVFRRPVVFFFLSKTQQARWVFGGGSGRSKDASKRAFYKDKIGFVRVRRFDGRRARLKGEEFKGGVSGWE